MKNETEKFQLLLVDDDALIRTGLEKIIYSHFSISELNIISCENGLVALQVLEQEPIDLLITDIKMPLCSGVELLRIINEQHIPCPSIVLSGYDDFNLVRSALRYGAKDYLLKPVDEELLIRMIEEARLTVRHTKTTLSENASASTVLKMQKLLEDCFSDSLTTSLELSHFLKEHQITEQTPCLMCYIDIKRSLYSNQFTMFQFLADLLSTYLSGLPAELSGELTAIYGGIGSFWIVILFARTKTLHPLLFLQPFLDILEQDHLKFSYTSSWYTLSEIHAADELCKKGFETYYYDLPFKKRTG